MAWPCVTRQRWSTGLDATSRSRRSLICDCRGQDAHRWRDAALRRAGEAQHEAALARAADIVRREGRRMDLAFERVPARRYVVGTKLEPRDEVEARLGVVVDREEIVRLAAKGLDEGGPPSGIEDAHAAEVRREAAFGEEARDDALVEARGVTVGRRLELREVRNRGLGHDEVAKPQARRQHLAEGPEVEDAVAAVEGVERDRKSVV